MSTEAASASNERIAGRYEIRRRLGKGGMAEVFLAYDHKLGRQVALKRLLPDYARVPEFRRRFLDEARLAAQLNHPNIVTVHDVVEVGPQDLYIVMEYVPGTTLETILQTRAPLPLDEALHYIIQASAGLGYAHRAGLVHGDVKPGNFLVRPDGRLKVADFGLARAYEALGPTSERPAYVWGSPPYLSPEHARGEPLVPASDVYALGVVLYRALTARYPFQADSAEGYLQAHLHATPIPPRTYRPDLPERLEAIVLKALDKRPTRRFRTADQMGRVLLDFLEDEAHAASMALPSTAPPARGEAEPEFASEPLEAEDEDAQAEAATRAALLAPEHEEPAPVTRPAQAFETEEGEAPATPVAAPQPGGFMEPESESLWDPGTLALAILALIAVVGLVPLWLWVYFLFRH
ncbi:MAG: serine/threonine protein kinase [Chloroflexi bacterium]|nr:serine/threonine protein kinase [Chloroflexota bacterium]